MNKKLLVISFFALSLVCFTSVARAAPNSDKWVEQKQKWTEKWLEHNRWVESLPLGIGKKLDIQDAKEKICKSVQGKVGERWNKYEQKRLHRVDNFSKALTILERRIEFFKDKDLDTGKLETDLLHLRGLIDDYRAEYTEFLDMLETAKLIPCGNSEGEFLPALKEAKEQWSVVKQNADSIRDYYRETVRVHLQELRVQLEDKVGESEEQ